MGPDPTCPVGCHGTPMIRPARPITIPKSSLIAYYFQHIFATQKLVFATPSLEIYFGG
jgi:hypothetical protein